MINHIYTVCIMQILFCNSSFVHLQFSIITCDYYYIISYYLVCSVCCVGMGITSELNRCNSRPTLQPRWWMNQWQRMERTHVEDGIGWRWQINKKHQLKKKKKKNNKHNWSPQLLSKNNFTPCPVRSFRCGKAVITAIDVVWFGPSTAQNLKVVLVGPIFNAWFSGVRVESSGAQAVCVFARNLIHRARCCSEPFFLHGLFPCVSLGNSLGQLSSCGIADVQEI